MNINGDDSFGKALTALLTNKALVTGAKVGGFSGMLLMIYLGVKELKGAADQMYASVGALERIEARLSSLERKVEMTTPVLVGLQQDQRERFGVLADLVASIKAMDGRVEAVERRLQSLEARLPK